MTARADFLITRLTDEGCTVQAKRGRIVITPPSWGLNKELRAEAAALKAELLEALQRWPNATAPARDFRLFPRRADEIARPARQPSRAITRRPR